MASMKNEAKKVQEEQQEVSGCAETELKKEDSGSVRRGKEGKREPVYTVDEFCKCAQALFHTRPECVRAAFREKRIVQCGKAEAQKTVKDFIKKEVK